MSSIPSDLPTDPRALVRAFMRGEQVSFKQGYTAPNAALSVIEMKAITDDTQQQELHQYATGFETGMLSLLTRRIQVGTSHMSDAWRSGFHDGLREDPNTIHPGAPR